VLTYLLPFKKNFGSFILGELNGKVDHDMSKMIRDQYYVAWNHVDLRCKNGVIVGNGHLPYKLGIFFMLRPLSYSTLQTLLEHSTLTF
jgi:hypothetical protein